MEATCGDHVTNGSKNSWLSSVELWTLKPNARAVHMVSPTSPPAASWRRALCGANLPGRPTVCQSALAPDVHPTAERQGDEETVELRFAVGAVETDDLLRAVGSIPSC